MIKLKGSIQDVVDTIKKRHIWMFLGAMEVKQRYKRSLIGPWWISISMLIFVLSMSVVYSKLFHQNIKEYLPFFTAGFLVWQLISSTINEATDLFRNSGGYIKQINLPYNIYVFKHLTRQVFIFLHNAVIYLLVAFFFQVSFGWNSLFVIPGLLLLIVNLYWISLLVGLISTRYRDMAPIISSCVQVAFFITPISWMPKLLSADSLIIKLNPFAYYIEMIRSPLLNIAPSLRASVGSLILTVVGMVVSIYVLSRVRHRISFWVD